MQPKESLEQSIEHFRELQSNLIEKISNICNTPREKIIQEHYENLLSEKAQKYIEQSRQLTQIKENPIEPSQTLINSTKSLEDYVKLIQNNPNQKESIIQDFLATLPELESSDINILVNNLKSLTKDKLLKELQTLEQLFST